MVFPASSGVGHTGQLYERHLNPSECVNVLAGAAISQHISQQLVLYPCLFVSEYGRDVVSGSGDIILTLKKYQSKQLRSIGTYSHRFSAQGLQNCKLECAPMLLTRFIQK